MSYVNVKAVIDCQGFTKDSKFVARELAIVSDGLRLQLEFETEICYDNLTSKDRKTVRHQQNYIHGLTYRPERKCTLKSTDLGTVLKQFYEIIRSEGGVFGCNNHHLEKCLRENDIPYVAITDAPKDCETWTCSFHFIRLSNIGIRCAVRKSIYLWKFICDSRQST